MLKVKSNTEKKNVFDYSVYSNISSRIVILFFHISRIFSCDGEHDRLFCIETSEFLKMENFSLITTHLSVPLESAETITVDLAQSLL